MSEIVMIEGYFTYDRMAENWTPRHRDTDRVVYHGDGGRVVFTGIIGRWRREDPLLGPVTLTWKGFDGREHPDMESAVKAWESAGRPSFKEPTNWVSPRYATED